MPDGIQRKIPNKGTILLLLVSFMFASIDPQSVIALDQRHGNFAALNPPITRWIFEYLKGRIFQHWLRRIIAPMSKIFIQVHLLF